jgi:DNA-binding beta-propeller fold protein YncE
MLLLATLLVGCGGGTSYVQFDPGEPTPTRVQSDNGLITALIPPEALDGAVEVSLSDRSEADRDIPGAEGRSLAIALEFLGSMPAPVPETPAPEAAASAVDNRFIPAELSGSVAISVRLAAAWPTASPLDLYSYNEASRRYEQAGISASLAEDGLSLDFTLTNFGRYALYAPLADEYPLPAPPAPMLSAASTVVRRIELQPLSGAAGYNLYRAPAGEDGAAKLNSEPLTELRFVDILAQPGSHDYSVTALRENGVESAPSAILASPAVNFDLLRQITLPTLQGPGSLLFDGQQSRLLVCDPAAQALLSLSEKGDLLRRVDRLGSVPMRSPSGLSIDPDNGMVYLSDAGYGQVFLLDSDLNYSSRFGASGTGPGEFLSPCGMAADGQRLLVVDRQRNLLQSFTPLGVYLSAPLDPLDSQFALAGPQGMWRLPDGSLALADSGNGRVMLLAADLSLKSELLRTDDPAGLAAPFAVVSDVLGRLYVSEPTLRRVSVFSSSGEYLFQFGSEGQLRVEFGAEGPQGLAYDPSSGYLYVADPAARRIAVFTS